MGIPYKPLNFSRGRLNSLPQFFDASNIPRCNFVVMTKKVYSLDEFCALERPFQIDRLYEAGIYIGKRHADGRDRVLYQYNDFYIEVIYEEYRKVIEDLICSRDTTLLDPYLGQLPGLDEKS